MVFRTLVEKKQPLNTEAKKLLCELRYHFEYDWIKNLNIIQRYDVENISEEIFEAAKYAVFADPVSDNILDALPLGEKNKIIFAAESLPGQQDQKQEACSQCLQIMTKGPRPLVRCAAIYIIETAGEDKSLVPQDEIDKIKKYIINPSDFREASLGPVESLHLEYDAPNAIETLAGFCALTELELGEFAKSYALAMDADDLLFCQNYFKTQENRDPTLTEIRMIDAYWSDHCRHTTFFTEITDVEIEDPIVKNTFLKYLEQRQEVYTKDSKKSVSLMDLATIGAKYLKKKEILTDLDESEEINACSVNIKVKIDDRIEDYLLMFKNETHNHPMEIEPFGGAATALGGDIRDVLAGRAVPYQGMRVTGSADPRTNAANTLKNKLPQFKITKTAAQGFSSYGNRVGAATGSVFEIYHPNYVAKRLELGAVIGAVPKAFVNRQKPIPGDAIILLGDKTGRDACDGATSSSKSRATESRSGIGAAVPKGDPLEERKIIRMFRDPKIAQMIKRCNDFGAGGVSVAIGELSDGIFVDLSLVPAKYPGLDGTELAISESQERMAVVVAEENVGAFIREAAKENLEATRVATVTDDNRLKMVWNGDLILSLDRGFLNSSGATKRTKVKISEKNPERLENILCIMYQKTRGENIKQAYVDLVSDLNICSQKGLVEQFDFSVGAASVVSPLGGCHRLSPAQFMAAKIPVLSGNANTASLMAHGFSPYVSEISPYRGALYAVVDSVTKLVAAGVEIGDMHLSFQEYFPKTVNPEKFGLPFEALLGALEAQTQLEIASIGGKDSMSGTYYHENSQTGEEEVIDVPPTLVSFAVGTADADKIISNEFKGNASYVYLLKPYYTDDKIVDFEDLKNLFDYVGKLIKERLILSSYAVGFGGVGEAIFKLCIGNGIGFDFAQNMSPKELFSSFYGAIVVESTNPLPHGELLGKTSPSAAITINGETLDLNELTHKWLRVLEDVFPTGLNSINSETSAPIPQIEYRGSPFSEARARPTLYYNNSTYPSLAGPRVLIPVFPGTNGEYDVAKHFADAGVASDIFVFCNKTPQAVAESIDILAQKIAQSQMVVLPGGFSGSDEPGGAGKFIAAVFKDPKITEATRQLLFRNDGLMLGLGNGFQALLRLGLLPYGDIKETLSADDLCVVANKSGNFSSYVAYTKVISTKSPWLSGVKLGDVHAVPVSCLEGRVYCENDEKLVALFQSGQIATQYCDLGGNATMHPYYNPSASAYAIEGIFSPDGRVFGKMGHSERAGSNVIKNVPKNKSQLIFTSGVRYFR